MEVMSLVVNLLFSKECREGARCFRCTTVHSHAQLNHAKLPQHKTGYPKAHSARFFFESARQLLSLLSTIAGPSFVETIPYACSSVNTISPGTSEDLHSRMRVTSSVAAVRKSLPD